MIAISGFVSRKFLPPKVWSRLRPHRVFAPVTVPKTSMDENRSAITRQHNIRFSGKAVTVKPKSETCRMKRFSYLNLGASVAASNRSHVSAACFRYFVLSHPCLLVEVRIDPFPKARTDQGKEVAAQSVSPIHEREERQLNCQIGDRLGYLRR